MRRQRFDGCVKRPNYCVTQKRGREYFVHSTPVSTTSTNPAWSVAHLLAEQLDLLGFGDVQLTQLGLQVAVILQLKQGLGNGLLELVGLRVTLLDDFGLRGNRHLHKPIQVGGVLLLNIFIRSNRTIGCPEKVAPWPRPRGAVRSDGITYLGCDFRVLVRRLDKGEKRVWKLQSYVPDTKWRMAALI